MQGETLKAELADCGDITALPGLTEMLTTYVILSRVRKADCLLLMSLLAISLQAWKSNWAILSAKASTEAFLGRCPDI